MTGRLAFGIDIGGSGIKGAPVDLDVGDLAQPRLKIPTPQPSTPKACAKVVEEIVRHFEWTGPVGITYPGVVQRGVVRTAANVDKGWIGVDAGAMFTERLGQTAVVLNDADAAGVAEMRFGIGRERARGVIVMLTLGTGIGCAVFNDGVLLPNTEFGHMELDGKDAEETAAARVRDELGLSWKEYAKRVSRYINALGALLWPDLVVIGGGVSRKADKWLPYLDVKAEVVAAQLTNEAGIIGAALAAPPAAAPVAAAS